MTQRMTQPVSEPERSLSAVLQPRRGAAMPAALVQMQGPCRLQIAGARSIHVHLALEGSVVLETGDIAGPIEIPEGRCVIVLGLRTHALVSAPGRDGSARVGLDLRPDQDRVATVRLGADGPRRLFLTAVRDFDEPLQALLRGLPPVLTAGFGADADQAGFVLAPGAIVPMLHGRGSAAFAAALAELCFVQAVRGAFLKVAVPKGASGSIYRHPAVSAAVNRINAAPGEAWTVPRLAETAGMSRSAFAAAFRRHVGQSPGEFVAAVRMDRALALLGDRRILTSQIARRLGYRSESAFIRAFRKRHGAAPGAFRAWSSARQSKEPPEAS
jgi:AraC-like DNA-binding protein